MKMTIGEIAKAINANIDNFNNQLLNRPVTGVCFDTRKMQAGQLFIPLAGEHDGHDYIDNAILGGAVATLWSKEHVDRLPLKIPALVVDDPLA
ncbi:MAG: Mur ligase domain-containing protein, partial [Lentilactobacillus parabuchneri]|nr:Mur ligase domain-containing protein [Lentilactobacillus parabuchneri]